MNSFEIAAIDKYTAGTNKKSMIRLLRVLHWQKGTRDKDNTMDNNQVKKFPNVSFSGNCCIGQSRLSV